jgi:spermidine/putrescine transport system ATP-binding protein
MQDELKAIQKRVGTTFIHVTHDQEEAMAIADHVIIMNHGRIEDQGSPERVYGRPATRFTATFMGESTILPGRIAAGGQIETALGTFPAKGAPIGAAVHVAIRPEHVALGSQIAAVLHDVAYQGSFKRVTAIPLANPEIRLLARLPAEMDAKTGDHVSLTIDPSRVTILKV